MTRHRTRAELDAFLAASEWAVESDDEVSMSAMRMRPPSEADRLDGERAAAVRRERWLLRDAKMARFFAQTRDGDDGDEPPDAA